MRGFLYAAGACLVIVAVALLAARRPSRGARATGAPPAAPEAGGPPAVAAEPPESPGWIAEALATALAAGGPAAQDAAAEMRRLLRTDPQARRAAEETLLDPATPRELRIVLALVLGTLGADAALLEALERFSADSGFVAYALLALGATREPLDEDEVFDLGDRPHGEGGPGGIGITVRREIDDPRVRAVIARHLAAEEAAVRRAAAVALRSTMEQLDVRDAFLTALRGEADDGVAGVVGEALAQWAGGSERDGGERSQVVETLLRRAGDEGLDGFRFRLEDDFARIPLGPAERTVLAGLTRPPRPLGIRSFAITALAASAARAGGEPLAEARHLLGACLGEDPDDAVRDLAARMLGRLPADEGSVARLARAASGDASWRVRYAAVEALGASGGPAALAALRAAASDSDERVAERARELLNR